MNRILSYHKFQAIKNCTTNNENMINQIIEETEMFDFKKMVGEKVYKGIIAEIEGETGISEKLQVILDGGIYQCISYLAYANWLLQGNVQNTFSGPAQKNMQDSEHISLGQIKNLVVYNKDIAHEYYNGVKDKLNQYFKNNCYDSVREDGFSSIIGISRNCNNKLKINVIEL